MASLGRELVFLILQFLEEEKHMEAVHKLEKESGVFFNLKHFEEGVMRGEWEEVEKYLMGFTKLDDNRHSMKIFFEIRKQKYLEALDKRDRATAVEILMKELKVFSTFNEDLFKELTLLLSLDNFRENEQLSKYVDSNTARQLMFGELRKLIEVNPVLRDKLVFPNVKNSRLRSLINQSLNWQHQLCKNPRSNPDIRSLFYDHTCPQPNGALHLPAPAPHQMVNLMPRSGGFPQMGGANGVFQPMGSSTANLAGWMANSSNAAPVPPHPMHHQAVSGASLGLPVSPQPGIAPASRRPITPTNSSPAVDYHPAELAHVPKRQRFMVSDEVAVPNTHLPAYPSIVRIPYSCEELPMKAAVVLDQGSSVMCMDFHPSQPTVILVGTNVGDVAVWEVSSRERLAYTTFKVWDLSKCSTLLQSALAKDPSISVNRVMWNPEGSRFGVAFSKHLVHLYGYNGRFDLAHYLEIDAHAGGVNDIAFSQPKNELCVVTCGDDKTIKVWDAITGAIRYTLEGHEAPVYSICPHSKEDIQFIFSTSLDGKIKAWLYDNAGPRVDYTAPGRWCTTLAYSTDGTRLFSCGTSKEGESYLVEWNESEGSVKRTFGGFRNRSMGVVQFDTTKNRFLAAGDECRIKFWDMDDPNLLTSIDAEGELPASPRIRFNKFGSLLAVSTNNNCIKILANGDGFQLLRALENQAKAAISPLDIVNASAGTSAAGADRVAPVASLIGLQNGGNRSLEDVKPIVLDESIEKSKIWKLAEIREPFQCRTLKLPDGLLAVKVSRLSYTSSGMGLLALTCNAVHKLWKWKKSDGKASTLVSPVQWQPSSGILMTNDYSDANPEETVHCCAISKNDSYVMSTSGGKISLFNLMTFKTMATFMPPPPAAISFAFHPQDNNIIAIGMDDSSIHIYNVRTDEVKSKLRAHQKSVTGLAFSNNLQVLVSSGADAQLCLWRIDGWEKQASKFLQVPSGRASFSNAETRIQIHRDNIHFLVVQEVQLAVYEATKLECSKQWTLQDGSITHAEYSSESQMIYASLRDGSVNVFTSALQLRCRISPSAYLPSQPSSNVYPVIIAANPVVLNQFALGLNDGSVLVVEPSESEGSWGSEPPLTPSENGVGGTGDAASSSQLPVIPVSASS